MVPQLSVGTCQTIGVPSNTRNLRVSEVHERLNKEVSSVRGACRADTANDTRREA
jgi:hypothetical protein